MTASVPKPTDVVRAFFAAMSAQDMDAMDAVLAPGFRMTVSGGHTFSHPRDFAAHSRTRQKTARKHTDRYEEIPADGGAVVYAIGTMSGQWNDGTDYAGVRYIDRFAIRDGRIADLRVWSDMAEFRPRGV